MFSLTTRHVSHGWFRSVALAAAVAGACFVAGSTVVDSRQQPDRSALLRTFIRSEVAERDRTHDPLARALVELYGRDSGTPRWIDQAGELTVAAREAIDRLRRAADDGLDPGDYEVQPPLAVATAPEPAGRLRSLGRFDVDLSAAMLRYLADVHSGRLADRRLWTSTDVEFDAVSVLKRHATRSGAVDRMLAEARPPRVEYERLRQQLQRYRALQSVRLEARALVPGPRPSTLVAAGPELADFLANTGDLQIEPGQEAAARLDAASVTEALRRFQRRHGLAPDGVIGPATRAALLIPLAWRTRQIELALERLRWLPLPRSPERVVVVNIPMFRLWAWSNDRWDGQPALDMAVIVGRARRSQTPVFSGELAEVIFRPYWNVPRSILIGELLPRFERESAYLQREAFEIVLGDGDDARIVEPSAEAFRLLRSGKYRLRQRPGGLNALGLVKFVFPNPHDVFMHGTPAQALFSSARRDFSHGCIRVEDTVTLASWVLAADQKWTPDDVRAAMAGRNNVRVPLTDRVRVLLVYITAMVGPRDDMLHFADDIYGDDVALDLALRKASRR